MRWRWPWSRAETLPPLPFDALLDLGPAAVPAGVDPAEACRLVADALRALPGANWIDVQVLPRAGGVVARAFPPGSSVVPGTPAWAALRLQLEQCTRATLATAAPPVTRAPRPPAPALAAPAGPGFAETMAASPLAALDELAALARSVRTPAAPPLGGPLEELAALAHATRLKDGAARLPAPPAPDAAHDAVQDGAQHLGRLLALVLPTDPGAVAARALARFGSYAGVLAAPEIELRRVQGLGTHSIAAIKLMHEAALRLARARVAERPVLDDRGRLADYLAAALARNPIEQFRILFLRADGMLLADELQAAGTVNHTPVYPREVVRRAIEHGAAALILVHNHPSGDPSPSGADLDMTEQVRRGLDVMGIELRDHVIVGNGRWLSFRAAGLLGALATGGRRG